MAVLSRHDVLARLAGHVVTPVIRESSAARARAVIDGLRGAGFGVFEITLSIPDALDIVAELGDDDTLAVGVGTVFTADEARDAVAAGARFVVSPVAAPAVAEAAHAVDAAAVLGALTPTEVVAAREAGADAVKIFPVSSAGGAAHLRALRSVFPEVPLIPTGGVGLDNLTDFLAAGAHSVGVGGALSPADVAAIPELGRRFLAAAERFASHTPGDPPS